MVLGRHEHNHPGQVGAVLAAKITARTKKQALNDLFKPAMVIVNEVLMEEMTAAPCPSLPKPINLAKAANYLRQRLRPSDPTDLDFEIDANHIPDRFMQACPSTSLRCLGQVPERRNIGKPPPEDSFTCHRFASSLNSNITLREDYRILYDVFLS